MLLSGACPERHWERSLNEPCDRFRAHFGSDYEVASALTYRRRGLVELDLLIWSIMNCTLASLRDDFTRDIGGRTDR